MMEVKQPLGSGTNGGLELSKSVASIAGAAADVDGDILVKDSEVLQENGNTNGPAKRGGPGSVKGLEDEDEMERLLLSEPEEEDPSADATEPPTGNETEVQNISDTLIEDIIALNKDSKRTDEDEAPDGDRLGDESSDVPPSSVQTTTEEEDTNGVSSSVQDDDTLTDSKAEAEEEEEDALLVGEDGDVAEADESMLLEDAEAIQIEDTAIELTDSSIAVVDETGLSILNTAAVDITDELADETSLKVGEESVVAAAAEEETPVSAMMEEMVTSIADNLKAGSEESEKAAEQQETAVEQETGSPESGEMIKFPDVDKIVAQVEQKEDGDGEEQSEEMAVDEADPEVSDLIKFNSAPSIDEDADKPEAEVSDLMKFNSVAASADDAVEKSEPEVSDLIKFPQDSVVEVSSASDIPEAPREEAKSDEATANGEGEGEVSTTADAQESTEPMEETEEDSQADACPKALQAADEEDLLEMMDEPERDGGGEDPVEEEDDLDDQSSEFGSAKQSNGDAEDEGDFEGSDYGPGEEDDDGSRPAADDVEIDESAHPRDEDGELEDGEPPSKRKCSVDVREEGSVDGTPEITEKPEPETPEKASEEKEGKSVTEPVESTVEPEKAEEEATEVEAKDEALEKVESSGDDKEVGSSLEKATPVEATAENDSEKQPEKIDISQEEPVSEETPKESASVDDVEESTKADDAEKTVEEPPKEPEATTEVEPEKSAKKDDIEIVDLEEKSAEQEKAKPEATQESPKESPTEVVEEPAKTSTEEPAKEAPKKAEPAAPVEVLVIDDDDDVPEKKEEPAAATEGESKKDDAPVVPGKRPCPEDESEKSDESAKKIRLSCEEVVAIDEPKKDTPKEEKKSALDSIEPLKIQLEPQPEPAKELKPVRLDFLSKFKKPLEKMNRTDLEEFVLQKIVEGIAFKSTIAEMRTQLDSQDQLLQGYRQKVHDLNKQFKDLEMVHERVVKDLEKKNQHFITPVKITRAVGLQVSQPRFAQNQRQSLLNTSNTPSGAKTPASRSPVASPAPAGSPNKNSPQANAAQNRRLSYTRVPPTVVTAKTATPPVANQTQNRPGMTPNKPTLNSSPSTPINRGITPVTAVNTPPMQQQQQQQVQQQPQPSTPLPAGGSVLMRKKPLQKFTPMRPPLSLTQQVQQQQQTRQMQEQLLRQQIQEVQTSSAPGSPLVQSPQGSPLTRTPEPASSPVSSSARVPPIVMKKVTPQTKGTPTTMQIIQRPGVSGATVVRVPVAAPTAAAPAPAPAAVDNSMIDLTDDDDVPRTPAPAPVTVPTQVVPKSPITLINGQQQQQQMQRQQQQQPGMPPLVVINQQRLMARPQLQQRPMSGGAGAMVNGQPPRPMLMQRPGNVQVQVTNGAYGPRSAVQQTYKPRALTNRQMAEVNQRVMARGPVRQQTTAVVSYTHPAALPHPGPQSSAPGWKAAPPRPSIRINNIETGIVISWTMDDLSEVHAQIVSYQIYAYQETTAPPASDMWRHVGDVKAMLLPMAVTLTQFQEGQRYHFAVRAVDEHQRVGHFSPPRTWNESTPGKA